MSTKAYILIEVTPGKINDVAGALLGMPGVESADRVHGQYDIIAVVSVPDLTAIGDLVTGRIHSVDGIVRTVTCLALGAS